MDPFIGVLEAIVLDRHRFIANWLSWRTFVSQHIDVGSPTADRLCRHESGTVDIHGKIFSRRKSGEGKVFGAAYSERTVASK